MGATKSKEIDRYELEVDNVKAEIRIVAGEDLVTLYKVTVKKPDVATRALLNEVRSELVSEVSFGGREILNPEAIEELKKKFKQKAEELLSEHLPDIKEIDRDFLIGHLLHEMLGLGKLEIILSDPELEDLGVNCAEEPIWLYHKKYGWLKTDVYLESEDEIENLMNIIARRVGRSITIRDPLLDAHLLKGDRVNATLYPISTKGNTITIRKFSERPWTITDFLQNGTTSKEAAALVWLAMQYELNILISGGTASGKTSFLNVCMPFIQPNHRIVSIEDTREIKLPDFLYWTPFTVREPNPEGKGGVTMLELMVNALRTRPDRIVVGEIRRSRQAEVLFEAMHTGHSVYSTLHADTAAQTVRRLINPPIEIPETMLDSVHLNVVMFRDRRRGIRRTLEVAELVPTGEMGTGFKINDIFKWKPRGDRIVSHSDSIRLLEEINLHTAMTEKEIEEDIEEKERILSWLSRNNIKNVNAVGRTVAEYYKDHDMTVAQIERNVSPEKLLGDEVELHA